MNTFLAMVALQTGGVGQPTTRATFLNHDQLLVNYNLAPLPEPKVAPKIGLKFPYYASAFGAVKGHPELRLRFRFFSQSEFKPGSRGDLAARYMIYLWNLNVLELELDHSDKYGGLVDVYLANEGKPGGEQFFAVEDVQGGTRNVNCMVIYKFNDFASNLEFMRELSHEYGHATLPPIGGFKQPEQWANGHVGERLYMHWMLGNLFEGNITPNDVLGVSGDDIGRYLQKNASPYLMRIMDRGPNLTLLKGTSADSMNEFLGLVLAAEGLLPRQTFVASFLNAPKRTAMGYFEGLKLAVNDTSGWDFNMSSRVGKPTWVPLGKGTIKGGTVLERISYWARIKPSQTIVTVSNPSANKP